MALLLDFSAELLLEIIACLYAQEHYTSDQRLLLWPLSRTCRRLNTCCGHWIFATYHLCLLADAPMFRKPLTPLDTAETLRSWNFDAITARLQHFCNKASYVQNLILEDFGKSGGQNEDEPELFPVCILPDLVDALKCANKLASIKIVCASGGKLPLPLWDWITTKNLTQFSVGHRLALPPDTQKHLIVSTFQGYLYEEQMLFLDVSSKRLSYECVL